MVGSMADTNATHDKGGPAWWLLALSVPAVLTLGLLFLTRPLADDNAARTGVGGGFDRPLIVSPSPSPSPTLTEENVERSPIIE